MKESCRWPLAKTPPSSWQNADRFGFGSANRDGSEGRFEATFMLKGSRTCLALRMVGSKRRSNAIHGHTGHSGSHRLPACIGCKIRRKAKDFAESPLTLK